MTESARVELLLLGRFATVRDGAEIPASAYGGRKVRTLLKVLASRQGRFVSNEMLADVLWPLRSPTDPVANLQVLVNRARRALGDSALIVTGQGGYTLATSPACVVDTERFLAVVADVSRSAEGLRDALSWWQGDPLPEEAYDDWAVEYRAQLFRSRQQALERAGALAIIDGDLDAAVEFASRAVEAEPLREVAVVLLMRALAASGDGAGALIAYESYRRSLAAELGVDPSAEAAALHQQLLRRLTAREAPTRPRRGRRLGELPFVGRDAELELIESALEPASGRGGVVTVSGSSGSGKSRLLARLAHDVPMIQARAYLAESSEPWSLLRVLLREVLAQDIGYLDALSGPILSALGWLLPEIDVPSGQAPDPESRRLLMHEASLRLLHDSGLVVAVDDLQWCDPSSLGVLEAAGRRIRGWRAVLAFRPEEVAEREEVGAFLRRCDVSARVDLGALGEDSLNDLVADEDLVQALCRHTDRTPMAVVEVLRALAARGAVAPGGDGRWQSVDDDVSAHATTVARDGQRAAIAGRVAAQPDADRRILALLSLLAREVGVSTLSRADGRTEPESLESLSRLLRRGLARLGEQGWATSHDLVTEVVSAGLDDATRARLHTDLARALRVGDDRSLLAHHLRESGDVSGAAVAFADAAQRALTTFADEEASQLAGAGLALTPAASVRARLHEIRGQARQRLGDIPAAREDLRAALAFGTSGPARAGTRARLAMLALGADDVVRAAQLADLAVVEAADDTPTLARALEVASVVDMNLDHVDRSAQRASRALALYEGLGDAGGMARVLDARAMAQFLGGDVSGGEVALHRAADLFEDSGDLVRVVTPRSTAGHALVFAGRPEQGLAQVSAALDLARTLGHPEGQTYALWHRTEALLALGRGEEASADAAEALAIATRIGHRGWTATAWRAVGLTAQQHDDLDEALHAFRTSLQLSEHLALFACWAASRAAMVLAYSDSADEAVSLVEHALTTGPPLGHYEGLWAQAEVAAALGDPAAPVLAQQALDRFRAGGVRQGWQRLTALAKLSV